ncbi:MAG: alkaline phosphatase family protein [Candidatus Poribacteria bacterium]|nr:alkaline phosphatase family protein [Candidatus Poribacteria bacterium]
MAQNADVSRMSPAKRAIVIGMDGASMELVKNMIDWGHTPNMARLLAQGVYRPMIGVFPTLTPPGWTALSTGSWPGTHRVMDFNIRALGKGLDETVWGINTRLCQSEYLWNLVERVGRKPILVKWEMSWPPTVTTGVQVEGTGPGVSNHHQIAGYHLFVGGKWAPRPIGGQRDPETLDPSALQTVRNIDPVTIEGIEDKGWTDVPTSTRPPREVNLTIRPLARGREDMNRGKHGTPKPFFGLIYASGENGYDRVRICRSRSGDDAVAELGVGDWSDWWLDTFQIDGADVEGYVRMKLVTLTPEADAFELFVPQIWPREGYTTPAEVAGEIDREIGSFLQNPARDALGQMDDDTYFELLEYHHQRLADVAQHLTKTRDWALLMVETHAPDYASHFFLSQADEISGAAPETIQRCRDGLIRTYASVDRMIGRVAELADEDTVILICSDHGGTPNQFRAVDIAQVLEESGFIVYKAGTREIDWSKTRAVNVGLVHVFINLKGREPNGIVDPADYEATQRELIAALHAYKDPETGRHPFSLALTHADAEMVNLTSDLVGDVVYALRPEFDGAHGKQLPSVSFGIGGQHSTFILSGAGVREGVALQRQVRVVDVSPTLCYLLGLLMPQNVEGGVVYEALEDPNWHLTAINQLTEQ